MLWRVARGMQNLDLHITQIKNVSFIHGEKVVPGPGAGVQDVFGSRQFREFAPRGDVIGVNVSIDDIADLDAVLVRHTHVSLGIVDGIAHGAQTFSTSTEDIRGGDDGSRLK